MQDGVGYSRSSTRKEIRVILPALNESATISRVIRQIPRQRLRSLGFDVRVLVVDGHSCDGTSVIAIDRGAEVFEQSGRGKGNALRELWQFLADECLRIPSARDVSAYYVVLDADGTYPSERIVDIVSALESGYDVVLASRFLGAMAPGAMSNLNQIGNQLLSRIFRFLYGEGLSDVCTGMYGFNGDVFRSLRLEAEGFDIEAELFARARRLNASFKEVPIVYRRRIGHTKLVPMRAGLQIAWRMLLARVQDLGSGVAPMNLARSGRHAPSSETSSSQLPHLLENAKNT